MKQAKSKQFQNLSQMNGDNMDNIRNEASKLSGPKNVVSKGQNNKSTQTVKTNISETCTQIYMYLRRVTRFRITW
jgi:hypothetical protein